MKVAVAIFTLVVSLGMSVADVTGISVERAVARMKKDPKIVVVDIRTPEEFAKGHIKGAINVDVNDKSFAKKLAKLDRKKTYLMHCRSGGRSAASIPVWDRLGFKNVLHLAAGTLGWVQEEQPLVVPKKK
jgi:rhodanese-related sulfurtransferase